MFFVSPKTSAVNSAFSRAVIVVELSFAKFNLLFSDSIFENSLLSLLK